MSLARLHDCTTARLVLHLVYYVVSSMTNGGNRGSRTMECHVPHVSVAIERSEFWICLSNANFDFFDFSISSILTMILMHTRAVFDPPITSID
jgi:hypothetical protein